MNSEMKALDVHHNNAATNDPCAICGARTDPECGPELFLSGTEALVCYDCGRRNDPDLVDMLMAYREALYEREKVDEFARHLTEWEVAPCYTGRDDIPF